MKYQAPPSFLWITYALSSYENFEQNFDQGYVLAVLHSFVEKIDKDDSLNFSRGNTPHVFKWPNFSPREIRILYKLSTKLCNKFAKKLHSCLGDRKFFQYFSFLGSLQIFWRFKEILKIGLKKVLRLTLLVEDSN